MWKLILILLLVVTGELSYIVTTPGPRGELALYRAWWEGDRAFFGRYLSSHPGGRHAGDAVGLLCSDRAVYYRMTVSELEQIEAGLSRYLSRAPDDRLANGCLLLARGERQLKAMDHSGLEQTLRELNEFRNVVDYNRLSVEAGVVPAVHEHRFSLAQSALKERNPGPLHDYLKTHSDGPHVRASHDLLLGWAKDQTGVEAVADLLSRYPAGPHVSELRALLEERRFSLGQSALKERNPGPLHDYLKAHSDGPHVRASHDLLLGWAKDQTGVEPVIDLLSRYPAGPHVSELRVLLEERRFSLAQSALRDRNPGPLHDYLKAHGNGPHVRASHDLLLGWAKDQTGVEPVVDLLSRYPTGPHVSELRVLLEEREFALASVGLSRGDLESARAFITRYPHSGRSGELQKGMIVHLLSQARLKASNEQGREALVVLEELLKLVPNHREGLVLRRQLEDASMPSKVGERFSNSIGMKLTYIPAGEYMRGSPAREVDRDSHEGPQHRVRISKAFLMGTTEVTQGQWRSVMGTSPSHFKGGDDLPVEQVSWEDAVKFCKKLSQIEGRSYRLATEAEWEYACRAGTAGPYAGTERLDDMGWNGRNSGGKTQAVGHKQPNAWGLYDMHGNTWEWCSDWYGSYRNDEVTDTTGPANGFGRVLRGGSWLNDATYCRSAFRSWSSPVGGFSHVGFRVVLDLPL